MMSKALNELLPPLSLGRQTTSLILPSRISALLPTHCGRLTRPRLFPSTPVSQRGVPLTSFHTAPTPLSHAFLCFIWLQSGNHPVTYYMYNIYLLTCLNTVFATEIMLYGKDPVPVSWCLFQGTQKCLSDWKSSINIFWLLDKRSPGPWLLQPASDHVPSSERPLQVASSNQAGDAFGRNRADTELNSWTRKDQKGLKEGPGEQGRWGKTECAVWVVKGNHGWEASTLLTMCSFHQGHFLSLLPPFLLCRLLMSEGQSITSLSPGTTLPNVETSQSPNIQTSLCPPIPQLHTFQTPVYIISSTSGLFEKMHPSSLLNKSLSESISHSVVSSSLRPHGL